MTKTYLVSEELLRQVLDALEEAMNNDDSMAKADRNREAQQPLIAILASEPKEPAAWAYQFYGPSGVWLNELGPNEPPSDEAAFREVTPLYTKEQL